MSLKDLWSSFFETSGLLSLKGPLVLFPEENSLGPHTVPLHEHLCLRRASPRSKLISLQAGLSVFAKTALSLVCSPERRLGHNCLIRRLPRVTPDRRHAIHHASFPKRKFGLSCAQKRRLPRISLPQLCGTGRRHENYRMGMSACTWGSSTPSHLCAALLGIFRRFFLSFPTYLL